MKTFIIAAVTGWLLAAGPSAAEPTSVLKGTVSSQAAGDIEVISADGQQYIKFAENFSVTSQAESEVRHLDGQTGQTTFIAYLANRRGYQVYEVPEGLVIDEQDSIVVYSPLMADDLATVELRDE